MQGISVILKWKPDPTIWVRIESFFFFLIFSINHTLNRGSKSNQNARYEKVVGTSVFFRHVSVADQNSLSHRLDREEHLLTYESPRGTDSNPVVDTLSSFAHSAPRGRWLHGEPCGERWYANQLAFPSVTCEDGGRVIHAICLLFIKESRILKMVVLRITRVVDQISFEFGPTRLDLH